MVDALHQIGHIVLDDICALGVVDLKVDQVAGVAVIIHDFGGTVNDRDAHFRHFGNAGSLQCHFDSDSIGVADGNAYLGTLVMVFVHIVSLLLKSTTKVLIYSHLCNIIRLSAGKTLSGKTDKTISVERGTIYNYVISLETKRLYFVGLGRVCVT